MTKQQIGSLLKNAGIVNDEMINYALKVQKATKERLGKTLLRLRFVTDTEVAQVLAKQAGVGFTFLDGIKPETELLKQLPYNFAQHNECLPIGITDGQIEIAISDPFDEQCLNRLPRYTNLPIKIFVAPRTRLIHEIERIYYLAEHPLEEELERITSQVQDGRPFQAERVTELLNSTAVEMRASDIHISATDFTTLVSYRVDGVLQLRYSLPISMHSRITSVYKVESGMDIAELNRPQDGRMTFEFLKRPYDMRVSCVPTSNGDNLVIRILGNEDDIRSLEQLGFNSTHLAKINHMVTQPNGMILVTGPTGSGKSTTLYGMLRRINAMQKNVMTIEDPVEYKIPLIRQVAVNAKAGITFSSSIRSFLRQDPDVIMIGEIRDEETATLSTRASQTGHLVLSTLHTNNAAGAIARLRDLNVSNFLLASTLSSILAQRLVRRLCPYCKQEHHLSSQEQDDYGINTTTVYQHTGCAHCHDTGYLGRTTVTEILHVDDRIRTLIDENASPLTIENYAIQQGMVPLRLAGKQLIESGQTDLVEVNRVLRNDDLNDCHEDRVQDDNHRQAV